MHGQLGTCDTDGILTVHALSTSGKVELILFNKLKPSDRGREDRVVKLRLLLQQVVAMEKHLPPDDSGVHPVILFTPEARHSLGTMSEAEREAWGKDLTQFTARGGSGLLVHPAHVACCCLSGYIRTCLWPVMLRGALDPLICRRSAYIGGYDIWRDLHTCVPSQGNP